MNQAFQTGNPDLTANLLPPVDRIIDEGVSKHISSQVPDFVRADHEGFITFLEAYYEWLEQKEHAYAKTHTLHDLADLDTTIDDFLTHFHDEFIRNFPEELATDQDTGTKAKPELLMKRIRDFYDSKGTEKSYKLLFRVLYDSDLDFYYPKDDMLRLSDGKWIDRKSIKVTRDNDDSILRNFENRIVEQYTDSGKLLARAVVDKVDLYTEGPYDICELFLIDIVGQFQIDLKMQCLVDNVLYYETVWPQITGVEIKQTGRKFQKGDIIDIVDPSVAERNSSAGEGGRLRVTTVGLQGEILEVELQNSGVGYREIPDELTLTEEPSKEKRKEFKTKKAKGNFSGKQYIKGYGGRNQTSRSSQTNSFQGGGRLKPQSGKYIGNQGSNDGDDYSGINTDQRPSLGYDVIFQFSFGALAEYFGYYKGNDGHLSSNKRIQDSHYYQDFSYVLKSSESIKKYKSVLKKLIHPAGHEIFGKISLSNSVSFGTQWHSQSNAYEIPIIGHYTPYNFNTTQNLRRNSSNVDLYPHGFNPRATGGASSDGHIYGLCGGRLELTSPRLNADDSYKGFTEGSFVRGQIISNGMTANGGTGTVATWYLHRSSLTGGSAGSGVLFLHGVTGFFPLGSTVTNLGFYATLGTAESTQPIKPGNGTVYVESGLTAHENNDMPLGTGGTDAVYGGSAAAQGFNYDCWGIYTHPNSRGWTKIPSGISFGAVGLRWFFHMPFGNNFHSNPTVSTWLNPSGATSGYPYYGSDSNGYYSLPGGISTGSANLGGTSCCSSCT